MRMILHSHFSKACWGEKRIGDSTYMTTAFLGPEGNKGNIYLMTFKGPSQHKQFYDSMIFTPATALSPFFCPTMLPQKNQVFLKGLGWRKESPASLGHTQQPQSFQYCHPEEVISSPSLVRAREVCCPQMEGCPEWYSAWPHTKRRHLVEANGKWGRTEIRDANRTQREKTLLLIFHMESEPDFLCGHPKLIQVTHNTSCVPKCNLLISIIALSCSAFSGHIHSGCFNLEPQKHLPRGNVWNFHGHYWKEKGAILHPPKLLLQKLDCCTKHTLQIQEHHMERVLIVKSTPKNKLLPISKSILYL